MRTTPGFESVQKTEQKFVTPFSTDKETKCRVPNDPVRHWKEQVLLEPGAGTHIQIHIDMSMTDSKIEYQVTLIHRIQAHFLIQNKENLFLECGSSTK